LGHCLFDFIGVSGAGNPKEYAPFVMNDETMSAFIHTIKCRDNYEYGMSRLAQVGLSEDMEDAFAISRLVAMARIFTVEKKYKLMNSVSLITEDTKKYLFEELEKPGTAKDPAIELQYAPAILNQVINGESEEVVSKTLSTLAYLFKQARNNIHDTLEIYTFNLIDFASNMKANPLDAINNVETSGMEAMSGGWKWTKT
jgi:hypothetical protein